MLSFLHKSEALILFILCTFPGSLLSKAGINSRFRHLWSLLYSAAFQKGISDTVRSPSHWLWLFQSGCRRWHWLWIPWSCYWKASFSAQRWTVGCCFPRCCWKCHSARLWGNRSARHGSTGDNSWPLPAAIWAAVCRQGIMQQEHNQLINSRHKIREGELEIFNNDIPHHPHLFSIFRPSNGISLLFFIKHVNNGIILISFY